MRFLVLLVFVSFSVFADDSYLEVSGVTVKMTAKDSLTAKQKAVSTSYYKAFGKMLASYFPDAKMIQSKVSEEKIQNCVYDYSIDQEKFSGRVYIAKFSFRFDRDKVVNVLREYNIESAEYQKSKDVNICVYTQDYLESYGQLRQYQVVLFSGRRMVLKVPLEEIKYLNNSKIVFEKVDAQIYS